jgi:hypothetical protein
VRVAGLTAPATTRPARSRRHLIATFDGLLIQWLIAPDTAPHEDAVPAAVDRLAAFINRTM